MRERIIYKREMPNEAGELIQQRLRENAIVSIFANGYEGRALIEADFLNGRLQMAAGAPRLAFKSNCPVLPVYAYPTTIANGYEVIIGEPLQSSQTDKNEAMMRATADFLGRLTPIVTQRPQLWRGWSWFNPGSRISKIREY